MRHVYILKARKYVSKLVKGCQEADINKDRSKYQWTRVKQVYIKKDEIAI